MRNPALISTHAPRTGSDPLASRPHHQHRHFNPRSPHGERLLPLIHPHQTVTISTHAPRTGSDADNLPGVQRSNISTHAPRTGSDESKAIYNMPKSISTHAPRTGSDIFSKPQTIDVVISTHAPRTGSDQRRQPRERPLHISTHAPRTGSDDCWYNGSIQIANFNPRSPHGERPVGRAGLSVGREDFNPRSPHGERRNVRQQCHAAVRFQPTLPARGATKRLFCWEEATMISTHAPRTGSD